MTTRYEYVTKTELESALKELDTEQKSRLYTVKGELMGHMDKMREDLKGELMDHINHMEERLKTQMTEMEQRILGQIGFHIR